MDFYIRSPWASCSWDIDLRKTRPPQSDHHQGRIQDQNIDQKKSWSRACHKEGQINITLCSVERLVDFLSHFAWHSQSYSYLLCTLAIFLDKQMMKLSELSIRTVEEVEPSTSPIPTTISGFWKWRKEMVDIWSKTTSN